MASIYAPNVILLFPPGFTQEKLFRIELMPKFGLDVSSREDEEGVLQPCLRTGIRYDGLTLF